MEDEEGRKEKRAEVEAMLWRSGLCHCTQESLGEYILLEQYFMAENIAKVSSWVHSAGGEYILLEQYFMAENIAKVSSWVHSAGGEYILLEGSTSRWR